MRFGPIPIERAAGRILGHNVFDESGRRVLRKGRSLSEADVETLRELGRASVYVAVLEAGDVGENEAARRITSAAVGDGVRLVGPSTGRVNVESTTHGVLRIGVASLLRLNRLVGVTLATVRTSTVVEPGRIVATTKILPYALPAQTVEQGERVACESGPLIRVEELRRRRVGLIVAVSSGADKSVQESYEGPLRAIVERLGSTLDRVEQVTVGEDGGEQALAKALETFADSELELIVAAGETAIQDRRDLIPRAIEAAGGEVAAFGAPVDPGNLVLIAELREKPVLGAPGCARSPRRSIVDMLLPRLLVGERLEADDLVRLSHGGLLEDVPERPLPRRDI